MTRASETPIRRCRCRIRTSRSSSATTRAAPPPPSRGISLRSARAGMRPARASGFMIDWPAAAMAARGNEGVSGKIKISEGSIGAVEYGFAKRLGLQMAALENKAGRFVAPSPDSGQAALQASDDQSVLDPSGDASYPIVTFSWLLLYRKYGDPQKAAAVKNFVTWGLTVGQTIAPGLGYLPLPAERAQRRRRRSTPSADDSSRTRLVRVARAALRAARASPSPPRESARPASAGKDFGIGHRPGVPEAVVLGRRPAVRRAPAADSCRRGPAPHATRRGARNAPA